VAPVRSRLPVGTIETTDVRAFVVTALGRNGTNLASIAYSEMAHPTWFGRVTMAIPALHLPAQSLAKAVADAGPIG
jgi:hypothetical protein